MLDDGIFLCYTYYIMEMFLYSMLVFLFGIFTAKVFSGLISLGLSAIIVRSAMESSLRLLGNAATDMAYIKQLKHKTMKENGVSDDTIQSENSKLEGEFGMWKLNSIQNIKLALSDRYEFMADFHDWEQAMGKLDEIYKTKN